MKVLVDSDDRTGRGEVAGNTKVLPAGRRNYLARKIAKNTIPSIRAAKMMDRVRMLPAAPGLRPVASAAFEPRRPMPIAAPTAARATWKLPVRPAA